MRPRESPVWFDDDAQWSRLRDTLARLEFNDTGIARLVGVSAGTSIAAKGAGVLHARTAGSDLGTLVRLFLMGARVPRNDLERALAPVPAEVWHDAGLIELEPDAARAAVQLLPLPGGRILASDLPHKTLGLVDVPEDYVMSIGRSTTMLADATVRLPSRGTLDLGTGSGYHALLAASHSASVLGTDRNPRAVGFARFNARANGLDNVLAAPGDLFGPAEGRTFDLIVTNPPFVITPGRRFIYRDSGLAGDEVVETICRTSPRFLNDRGYAQMICNWAHVRGRDWKDRLRSWFEGSGCDTWVLRSETLDAPAYASFWIRHTVGPDADGPGGVFDEWMSHYTRLGIEAVSMGMIFQRRRPGGRNWVRFDDEPDRIAGAFGHHVERTFANADFLQSLRSDDDLLESRLRLAPDARATSELEPAGRAEWRASETTLRLAAGLCYRGSADGHLLRLVAECDGTRPLRDPVARMARALMRDFAEVAPPTLGVVRALLERGFLLAPASDGPSPGL